MQCNSSSLSVVKYMFPFGVAVMYHMVPRMFTSGLIVLSVSPSVFKTSISDFEPKIILSFVVLTPPFALPLIFFSFRKLLLSTSKNCKYGSIRDDTTAVVVPGNVAISVVVIGDRGNPGKYLFRHKCISSV